MIAMIDHINWLKDRYGYEIGSRTSKNEFFRRGNHIAGVTRSGWSFIFDLDYADLISRFTWCRSDRYFLTTIRGKNLSIQNLIMLPEEGQIVDHIFGNTFDNRRLKLRFCTQQQNASNRNVIVNKHGFKGVVLRSDDKWISWLECKGKSYRKGPFSTKIEAAIGYNELAVEHFGEFARLNDIISGGLM
jgi:hypothetical protein